MMANLLIDSVFIFAFSVVVVWPVKKFCKFFSVATEIIDVVGIPKKLLSRRLQSSGDTRVACTTVTGPKRK
jgi:hypothetical protein